jgi:small GTP-binding protein
MKVLIVGNASCGKTSIIRRYVTDSFENEYITTVGADYNTKSIQWAEGVDVQLQLWDIAGQDRYARMTRPYFQGAHAAVVVCDVTREASITAVRDWKDDIDSNLTNIPVVLVANKCDLLADGMAGMEVGGRLQELCSEMNFVSWHIISAKRDMNVTEAMSNLVRAALDSKLEEQRRQQRWRLGKERQLQSQEQENVLPKGSKKKKNLGEPDFNHSTQKATPLNAHTSGLLKLDAKPHVKKADTCIVS